MRTVIVCPPRIGQGALLWADEALVHRIHALADVLSLANVSELRQLLGQSLVRWQDGIAGDRTFLCCTTAGLYLRRCGGGPPVCTDLVAYDDLLGPARASLLAV